MRISATAVGTYNGKTVYATPTGLRLGSKGKVMPVVEMLSSMSKGDRRRIRKNAYRAGLNHVATASILI